MENKTFDFWTKEENDLIKQKGQFTLAVNFGEDECVDSYIYEYDPILDQILSLSINLIHYGMGCLLHELLVFNIEKQYIFIKKDSDCKTLILGHYDTIKDVMTAYKLEDPVDPNDDDDYRQYIIINLSNCVPFFLKIGALRKPIENHNPATFI
jgi:hypothetical protein